LTQGECTVCSISPPGSDGYSVMCHGPDHIYIAWNFLEKVRLS